jgi:hypothetical protein
LGLARSIAAANWDTAGIHGSDNTSGAKKNRSDSVGRERHTTFSGQVAGGGFAEAKTYPEKDKN